MSDLFKTIQKSLPPKKVVIIKKSSDKYQGSRWGMVYKKGEYKDPAYQ